MAFPLGACPSAVAPSASFSGSWGSVALAVGLGCSVLVVLPSSASVSSFSPALGSCFRFAGVAPCGGSLWLSVPAPIQLLLF